MKIVKTEDLRTSIWKRFFIQLKNEEVIAVEKGYTDDAESGAMAESEWNVVDDGESVEIYEKLSDERKDEVDDFINELSLS